MTTYVFRDGKLVEKHLAAPKYSASKAPSVISDIMTETKHMATGRIHTSKSAFRQDTKASGCQEVGNDTSMYCPRSPIKLNRLQRRDDIRKAIYDLRNGKGG